MAGSTRQTAGVPCTVYVTNLGHNDRRGRREPARRNGITTTWTYKDADQHLTETHSAGTAASQPIA